MSAVRDIFISYASEDRAEAEKLAHRLEAMGWSTWWDRRIPPGQDYARVIEDALNAARCVIVLWSKESAASRWVVNEAGAAADRGILVPALIEQTDIPFEFRRIQAADLIGWDPAFTSESFNQLAEAIGATLQSPPRPIPQPAPQPFVQPGPTPQPQPKRKSSSRAAWLIGAGVSVVLMLGSCIETIDGTDENSAYALVFFFGLSIWLFVMGIKAK